MKPEKMTPEALETVCEVLANGRYLGLRDQLRAHIAALEAEVKSTKRAHEVAEAECVKRNVECNALRERVKVLESQLAASEERGRLILDAKNGIIGPLRQRVYAAESRIEAMRQRAYLIQRSGAARSVAGATTGVARDVARYVLGEDATGAQEETSASRSLTAEESDSYLDVLDRMSTPSPEPSTAEAKPCDVCGETGQHRMSCRPQNRRDAQSGQLLEPSVVEAFAKASTSQEPCPTGPDVPCEPMKSEPWRCVYGEHPMPTVPEPSTAEAFATVREGLKYFGGHLAALSLLERRMGAMARALEDASLALEQGLCEFRCIGTDGPMGRGAYKAASAKLNKAYDVVHAALTDAPAVYTLEEVKKAVEWAIRPKDRDAAWKELVNLRE